MRVREVLGVDFRGDRLNVVQVRQEDVPQRGTPPSQTPGPRLVLTHRASLTIPAAAESAALAAALGKMLNEGGFTATAAVLGLPRGRGFLRCQPGGQEAVAGFSPTDYVLDGWRSDDGREVVGVAARADVTRLVEIAHQASLQPIAVELRSLGCVRALGLLDQPAAEGAVLGVILGDSDVTAALAEGQVLLAVQTRLREGGADQLDRWNGALRSVEQMFRLIQMTQAGVTAQAVRLIVNAPDRQAAKHLADRVGVPVQAVWPGADLSLSFEAGELAEPAEYAAAIGLALEGLQEIPAATGRLNFLRPRAEPRRRWTLSWRHAAIAAAAAVVVAMAATVGYVKHRHSRLGQLQAEQDQLSQRLRQGGLAERRWRAAGPWLARADGGQRISHRRICDAITELFPTQDAYVRNVVIRPAEEGRDVTIDLSGRTRQRQVVHEFVSQLNRSPMFARARLGPVVDDAEESNFPTRFSVTFHLRQGG
jgi:Tfp pilus assembly protein PilN